MRTNYLRVPIIYRTIVRKLADVCKGDVRKGMVVGAYENSCSPTGEFKLTATGCKVDEECGGKIVSVLKGSNLKQGGVQIVSNLSSEYHALAVAGLGPEDAGYNEAECLEECKENIRVAAGVGARALQNQNIGMIMVEGFTCSEAAAEGAALAVWRYQDLKDKINWAQESFIDLYDDPDRDGWNSGIEKAAAQNLARKLEETPANIMTPANFAKAALDNLCPCGVHVEVRDKEWIESKKLNGFLSMARGSCEAPLLLDIAYCGGGEGDKPVVLIGKGVTFDSGGVCLNKCVPMFEIGGADMAGAAVVVAVMKGLATLGVPVNVNALIPLCENMPGGMAMKPGDVIMSHCGKSVLIERTDHEGRVILADALSFSSIFNPCLVIDIATLSRGMKIALGSPATGAFSTSNSVWVELVRAAAETGDRVWRFPFWKAYARHMTNHRFADVTNTALYPGGDPCTAAAFLREFAPCVDFVHLDITGTGTVHAGENSPYMRQGLMTGRPTRTIIQFLYQMSCPQDKPSPC
ncbi:cytosol aminopeptidase [Halyomorpha halys]|uniref:cytosol aminopeptidase n=1 Tax=Halyomorpha halys TaxID=286706 RepID=UPI0006D52644|nr:cytosol aminopeptidase-like [Halyomorpha halys]